MNWALYMSLQDKPWMSWDQIINISSCFLQMSLSIYWAYLITRHRKKNRPRPWFGLPDNLKRKVRTTSADRQLAMREALKGYERITAIMGDKNAAMEPAQGRIVHWDKLHGTFLMPFVAAYTRADHGDMYFSENAVGLSDRVAHVLEGLLDMDENTVIACNEIFDDVVKNGGTGTDVFGGTINYLRARAIMEGDGERARVR